MNIFLIIKLLNSQLNRVETKIKQILSPQNKQNKKWNKNLFEKQGKKSSLY